MNKQEAIKELYCRKNQAENTYAPNKWGEGHKNGLCEGLQDSIKVVEQLDEPKKPIIPQSVADWLEVCKENLAISLFFAMTPDVLEGNNQSAEVIYWLKSARNQETFAKAWIYGYEVEKEKLYTVRLKATGEFIYFKKMFQCYNSGTSIKPVAHDNKEYHHAENVLKELLFWDNPAFEIKEVKKEEE